tara:strand:- start:237 stop:596 length:360 start_codon:yes stop_codon:yes gene_type:complete
MLTPTEVQKLAIAKSKGKRPKYIGPESNDNLLSMVMVLAEELAVTRERADTLERLLEVQGVIARESIETFKPNEDEALERQSSHAAFVSRLIRTLRHELESLSGDNRSTEEAVEFLKKN